MTRVRDWLKEAFDIASGESNVNPKKKHVEALVIYIGDMAKKTQKLHSIMHLAYAETCKNRTAAGLPIPPLPDSLKSQIQESSGLRKAGK